MIFGFTGTQRGMAPRQLKTVRKLLWNADTLHLGDCVGADAEAHAEAVALGVSTVGHPPLRWPKRAWCAYTEEREPKDYIARNHCIVNEGVHGLIAAPSGWVEEVRSGTWATIRFARKLGRRIWIVLPDGRVQIDGGKK